MTEAVVPGRAAAERRMRDRFAVFSPTGHTVQDEDTGLEEPVYQIEEPVYGRVSGAARTGDTQTRMVNVGGVDRPVLEGGLHIPIAADVPAAGLQGQGWEYECIGLGPTSDPSLLGRRYLVVESPAKSDATARRLDVVEV